jgi:hypothetical protein
MKFTAAIALVGLVAAAQAAPMKMDAVLSNDAPGASYMSSPRMLTLPSKMRRWFHLE